MASLCCRRDYQAKEGLKTAIVAIFEKTCLLGDQELLARESHSEGVALVVKGLVRIGACDLLKRFLTVLKDCRDGISAEVVAAAVF